MAAVKTRSSSFSLSTEPTVVIEPRKGLLRSGFKGDMGIQGIALLPCVARLESTLQADRNRRWVGHTSALDDNGYLHRCFWHIC